MEFVAFIGISLLLGISGTLVLGSLLNPDLTKGESNSWLRSGLLLIVVALLATVAAFRYIPEYNVWQQGLSGQARLSLAEQTRKIRIEEARARLEGARFEADAEVVAATGAAKANEIMIKSIGSPDHYLRWKYFNMLEEQAKTGNKATIIYVPTEGQLPITEAMRLRGTKK